MGTTQTPPPPISSSFTRTLLKRKTEVSGLKQPTTLFNFYVIANNFIILLAFANYINNDTGGGGSSVSGMNWFQGVPPGIRDPPLKERVPLNSF